MSEIVVYAPADVIDVRLELAPLSEAAELEKLVLRAIDAGLDDVDTLAAAFGLTPRITYDLLGDLWTAGRIAVHLGAEEETIRVTADGRAAIEGRDDSSARREVRTSSVLLERLTGRVLPEGDRRRPDRAFIVPSMSGDRSAADVDLSELTDAVQKNLERGPIRDASDLTHLGNRRISSVRRSSPSPGASTARRFVPIRVQVWADADVLRVSVTDPMLGIDARARAASRLQAYALANPTSPFTRALRGAAGKIPVPSRSATEYLSDLRRQVDVLAGADPALRQSAHDVARQTAHLLLEHVGVLADREADVEIVTTVAEHEQQIQRLIDEAQRQLVLAVPQVGTSPSHGLPVYLDALTRAVERGVRVFLVWGLEAFSAGTLNSTTRNMLFALARRGRAGGGLRFADATANIHAKLVISDDRAALVTSRNYLSASDLAEVGAVVRAQEGRPAPAIEELLRWSADTIPDYTLATQLLRTAADFGTVDATPASPPIALPRFRPELADAEVDPALYGHWLAGWGAVVQELTAALERRRPVVRVLTDTDHHELVRQLLDDARHRAIVTSQRVSTAILMRDLPSRAREAVERGVAVELVYGELAAGTEAAAVEELLTAAALPHSGGVVRERPGNHAKVIVSDDISVIGSFNYLSFNGVSRVGMSSEVSLRISSSAIADTVAEALGAAAVVRPIRPPTPVPKTSSRLFEEAARISDLAASATTDAEAVAAAVTRIGADDVFAALRAADDQDGIERVLCALVAAGVAGPRDAWRGDLALRAWQRADWASAEALLPEGDPRLSRTTVELAASRASALVDHALAFQAASTPGSADAATAHLVAEYLLAGDSALATAIDSVSAFASPPLRTLASHALAHGTRFGALDLDAIRAAHERSTGAEKVLAAWDALSAAVDSLRSTNTRIVPGKKLLDMVFSHGSEYDALAQIIENHDAAGLRIWFDTAEPNAQRWVAQSAKEARTIEIVGALRDKFAARRAATVAAVAAVLEAEGSGATSARELLPHERESLDDLCALAAALPRGTAAEDQLTRVSSDRIIDAIRHPERPVAVPDWRTPRLRRATSVDREERVALAARDLFEIRSPVDAVHLYLRHGDIALAKEERGRLVASAAIDSVTAEGLARDIAAARDQLLEDFRGRLVRVKATAERLGQPVPDEVIRLDTDPSSWLEPRSAADLDRARAALDVVATDVAADIANMVEELADDRVRERVDYLMGLGELAEARKAISDPLPGGSPDIPIPPRLAIRSWTLAEVHAHLASGGGHRALEPFAPTVDDAPAQRVVEAIRGLAEGYEDAVAEYVSAVQALVAPEAPRPVIRQGVGGPIADFFVPSPANIPKIKWADDGIVRVAIGDSETSAMFRLATRIETNPPGVVIGIADVLALLRIPDVATREDQRARRLLRLIASQLPFNQVLDPAALSPGAPLMGQPQLARLLYTLGVDVTPFERAGLFDMLGPHPFVLWQVVERLKEDTEGALTFHDRRGRPDFDRLISLSVTGDPDARESDSPRRIGDLGASSAAVVLGTLIHWGGREGASIADLEEFTAEEVAHHWQGADLPPGLEVADVPAELERLIARRYVERLEDGRYRAIPDDTTTNALERSLRTGSWFRTAINRAVNVALVDSAAELDSSFYRLLLHDLRGAWVELDAQDNREARYSLDDIKDPRVPAHIDTLVIAITRRLERPEGVEILTSDIPVDVQVEGPLIDLLLVLRNALDNSVQSIRHATSAGREPEGFVSIDVGHDSETVTFTVRDSGPGFSEDVLTKFGAQRPVTSAHGTEDGLGLEFYRSFRPGRSLVTVTNHPEGGAVVTVRVSKATR